MLCCSCRWLYNFNVVKSISWRWLFFRQREIPLRQKLFILCWIQLCPTWQCISQETLSLPSTVLLVKPTHLRTECSAIEFHCMYLTSFIVLKMILHPKWKFAHFLALMPSQTYMNFFQINTNKQKNSSKTGVKTTGVCRMFHCLMGHTYRPGFTDRTKPGLGHSSIKTFK